MTANHVVAHQSWMVRRSPPALKFSGSQISLDILNLVKSLKLNNNTVVVSNIVSRDDVYKNKADEVSAKLEKLC